MAVAAGFKYDGVRSMLSVSPATFPAVELNGAIVLTIGAPPLITIGVVMLGSMAARGAPGKRGSGKLGRASGSGGGGSGALAGVLPNVSLPTSPFRLTLRRPGTSLDVLLAVLRSR